MASLSGPQLDALFHHHEYGHIGVDQVERAVPNEYMTLVEIKKPATEVWDQKIPAAAIARLFLGYSATSMDEKWNVYTDGPDKEGHCVVNMYRSWTGFKIVSARFVVILNDKGEIAEQDARFTDITWETEIWTLEEALRVAREVLRWVMGIELPPDETPA